MVFKFATVMVGGLFALVASAVILVLLGLVFFAVNLWIIKFAAVDLMKLNVAGDWIVLSAAILSAASMVGSRGR
ncbi:MAG: hypothetical protein NT067_00935 [Candidatus Diapherotrites archaeon]|jgi:hypothetical protein|nr:hypothetical protein [Candidatus Diapherotrites archaeon]